MANVKKWKCPNCNQDELEENIDNDFKFNCLNCSHGEAAIPTTCPDCTEVNYIPKSASRTIKCEFCNESFANPNKNTGKINILLIALIATVLFCICSFTMFFGISKISSNSEFTKLVEEIPFDEATGIKSFARIYWLGGGLMEMNIYTYHEDDYHLYENTWELKLVLDENAQLVTQFYESGDDESILDHESDIGFLYPVKNDQPGVFVFEPMYSRFLIWPNDFEHNFGFSGVNVQSGINFQAYLVIHQDGQTHEIPIHILNP